MMYNLNDLVILSRQLNNKVLSRCHCYVNLPKLDLNLSCLTDDEKIHDISVFLCFFKSTALSFKAKAMCCCFLQCLVSVLEALFVSDTNNGSWIAQ